MGQVPNYRDAKEFVTHPEGVGFVFQINNVKEDISKAGNDMLVISIANVDNDPMKPPFTIWVLLSETNYLLRKLGEACGVEPGVPCDVFEGKIFSASIVHTENDRGLFCNLVPKSITSVEYDKTANKDGDYPF